MGDLPANPIESRELAAFVAAVEAMSMHGAASVLSLTQSAVTKRVRALEQRLGVTLLDRGRFGVRPTEAGRVLYPEAKQALDALMRAESLLASRARTDLEELHLAASHTIGEFLLPGWLAGFRTAGPVVRVLVEIVNSSSVLRAVRDGTAQIGFVEGLDDLSGLESHTLVLDEIVAVVAAAHPWASRRTVLLQELSDEPYFTREEGSGTRAVAEAALARHGLRLYPALEADSTQSLKRAVLSGGFTLLSRLTVEREERTGELRGVTVRGVDTKRELRAVRARGTALTGAAERFWRWLERNTVARGTAPATPRTTQRG